MRRTAMTALALATLAALPLAACGDKDKAETKVQMKDMEVVDGTATDAMTDLDGVQSEGATAAMPAGNDSATADKAPAKPAEQDTEMVSDQ